MAGIGPAKRISNTEVPMLCIGRKIDQDTIIDLPDGRTMTVKVVRVKNGFVRLGFTAPPDVTIRRAELDEWRGRKLEVRPVRR